MKPVVIEQAGELYCKYCGSPMICYEVDRVIAKSVPGSFFSFKNGRRPAVRLLPSEEAWPKFSDIDPAWIFAVYVCTAPKWSWRYLSHHVLAKPLPREDTTYLFNGFGAYEIDGRSCPKCLLCKEKEIVQP